MARKNPIKESLIMLAVAGALLSLYVWVLRPYFETRKLNEDKSQLLYSGINREKILEFSIVKNTELYHLKKQADQENKWIVSQEPKSYEADASVVDGFFSSLLGAKIEKKLENVPALDTLGLTASKLKLSVKGEGLADNRELILGNDTPVDYFTYAKWSDSNDVILVSRSLRFALDKGVNDWRNRKVFNVDPTTLAKIDIKISRLDKHPATFISVVKENDSWKATPKNIPLDGHEVKTFFDRLASIQVANFVSQDPKDKNKYGFSNPIASMAIGFSDTAKAAERWVLSSAYDSKTKENKYYFFKEESDETYEVPEHAREHFRVDLMKFRNKRIYIPVATQIYGLKIHSDKGSVKIQKKEGQWFVKGGEDTDENLVPGKVEVIDKLVQTLTEMQIQEFYDGLTPYALGLQNPARIVEISNQVEGKEVVVSTLFFGKKLGQSQVTTLRSEGMEAAGKVGLNIEEVLRIEASYWAQNAIPEKPAVAASSSSSHAAVNTPQNSLDNEANQGEKKKMKLEPTVKTTAELKKLTAPLVKKGFKYTAEMTLNNGKKIVITFAPDKAPNTVSNFLHLARNGFYNNVKFHRVIPRFVVQGGDPTGTGRGGPGWMFDNEDNDLKHVKGSISMAHAGRNTNGSQFFLVLDPQPHLDGVHTVFGSITQGIDVMESIKQDDSMKTVEVFEEGL